jgi:hypothetical protein
MYYEGRKRLCILAVGYTSWTKAFWLRSFACTNIDSLENRNRLIFILHTFVSLFCLVTPHVVRGAIAVHACNKPLAKVGRNHPIFNYVWLGQEVPAY